MIMEFSGIFVNTLQIRVLQGSNKLNLVDFNQLQLLIMQLLD